MQAARNRNPKSEAVRVTGQSQHIGELPDIVRAEVTPAKLVRALPFLIRLDES